ncbi:MAG: hypothetical protein ACLFQ8_01395 [Candidatus Aenigmatarchaeota archaeon]
MSSGFKRFSAAFVFVLMFVLATAPSAASVIHRVDIQGDEITVNSSFVTETDEPTGGTKVTLRQDGDMEIISVESSSGEASYTDRNGSLVLETDSTFPRKEHSVKVRWRPKQGIRQSFEGLRRLDFGLFGFEDEETKAVVQSPDILSWHEPLSFRSQYFNKSLRFEGEGYLLISGYMSDEGRTTDTYYYSGNHNLSVVEELVPLVEYVTGTLNPHERIPVVFLGDEAYNEEFTEWSKGTYETGGLVVVRDSLQGTDRISTVLHETVHGFNSRALKWDETKTDYYDEGMAKFVELLVSEAMNSPRAEIFGEEVIFEENGSRYRLPPRSSEEELWSYYREEEDWIKHWSPRRGEFSEAREFGYALSELIVRNKVEEEGVESLQDLRRKLSQVERRIEDHEEKAELMEQWIDLRPCYSENRSEFEACLDNVNDQSFDLEEMNLNHTFEDDREEIEIEERVVEEVDASGQIELFFENFLRNVERALAGVSQWISKRL